MTAERDRLAALLHETNAGISGLSDSDPFYDWADRLIAAGVHLNEPDMTTAYMVGFEKGKDAARSGLAARIVAAVEGLPLRFDGSALDRAAVLDAIREASDG